MPDIVEQRCPHHVDSPLEIWRLNCPACWDGELRRVAMLREDDFDQLRAALHWCGEFSFDGQDIDGGEFQDHMEELGLMKRVPASEEFRAEYDADTMLAWCWAKRKGSAR